MASHVTLPCTISGAASLCLWHVCCGGQKTHRVPRLHRAMRWRDICPDALGFQCLQVLHVIRCHTGGVLLRAHAIQDAAHRTSFRSSHACRNQSPSSHWCYQFGRSAGPFLRWSSAAQCESSCSFCSREARVVLLSCVCASKIRATSGACCCLLARRRVADPIAHLLVLAHELQRYHPLRPVAMGDNFQL